MADFSERLREFIEAKGLSHKKNSRSYIFDCPRCKGDEKLYMEQTNGRFKCMKCASAERFQGRCEFALAAMAVVPLREVRSFLYGISFTALAGELDLQIADFFGDDDIIDTDAVDIPTTAFPIDYYSIEHEHASRGAAYLATRGIDLVTAMKYRLRFCPAERRVIFPVELGTRLVGWQKRLVVPDKVVNQDDGITYTAAKMLSSKDIPTAHVVMFANNLIGSEHAVVCEGPIDAIKADLCGGNIATMGKAIGQGQVKTIRDPARLTREQVSVLATSGIKRIYLALDPDAARETSRLVREFSDLECYTMLAPRPYHDLGDMPYDEVYKLFKNAQPASADRVYISFR